MTIEAEIIHGDLPVILDQDSEEGGPGELDSASLRILCAWPEWKESLREAGYVMQRPLAGYHAMFVRNTRVSSVSGKTCEVAVSCAGLMVPGEKRMRKITCAGQQVTVGPFEKVIIAWDDKEKGTDPATGETVDKVKRATPKLDELGNPVYEMIVTPSGSAERWNIHEAVVTVSDIYYSTVPVSTAGVGRAAVPPNPPDTPPFLWESYAKPVRHNCPSGWVLLSRDAQQIGPALWAVTDTYGYYHAYLPD